MKFKNYLHEFVQEMNEFELNAIKMDEGIDRSVIIQPSDFVAELPGIGSRKAEYEWTCDGHSFYLFALGRSDYYEFKFITHDLRIDTTKRLNGKPATSVFSGAILAIKEFLSHHSDNKYFSIDADTNDKNRVRLYRAGTKYIAKETGYAYLGEIEDDPKYIKFIFKKEI